MDKSASPLSLTVPDFFSSDETAETLKIFSEELDNPVVDRGLRVVLASAGVQPIQLALTLAHELGIGIVAAAGWAAIEAIYARLKRSFPGRAISIELSVEDQVGHSTEYLLSGAVDDVALRAIPSDLQRNVRGTRVHFNVAVGWQTWDESRSNK